ncbi:MAG: hypothetical protein LAT58_14175, partial [Opitutales bacterium]|nr:hypothetical protein [Opitutales bacterium]
MVPICFEDASTPRKPRKGSGRRYTQPAYLICTDPELPIEELLQQYIWRWDIEVNHRDEKTILGVGQAQVRKELWAKAIRPEVLTDFVNKSKGEAKS